jgi:NNP family nitrate/nitrite transporter-like MFS transporter
MSVPTRQRFALASGGNPGSERDMEGRATLVRLSDFLSAPMRAFHLSCFAFFMCFIAWFGIAPLMAVVRDDLKLTKAQIGNTVIASVAITVLARLLAGWLCDRFGPRRTYTALLILGALPVMGIGLAHSYASFLFFRLAIGLVGASFVITQYHTSIMFSPRVVGTANAAAAGWGNLGGGVAQWCMPLLAGAIAGFGVDRFASWRLAMVVPGIGMLLTGILYYRFTEDTPDGNPFVGRKGTQAFWEAAADYRVWLLFVLYAACFGVEITIDNVAALYFKDSFHVSLKMAGLLASTTGMMNIFARAAGGFAGDWVGVHWGLRGRSLLLGFVVFAEGCSSAWPAESPTPSCRSSGPARSARYPELSAPEAMSARFSPVSCSKPKTFQGQKHCSFWEPLWPSAHFALCFCDSVNRNRR